MNIFEQEMTEERKRDGFKGERMVVLPTEAFQDYVEHPLVRRLFLTDVGFFPVQRIITEKEGMELKNTFSFTVQREADSYM